MPNSPNRQTNRKEEKLTGSTTKVDTNTMIYNTGDFYPTKVNAKTMLYNTGES